MTLLYRIPSAILLLVAVVVAITAACSGQLYVHRRFSSQDFVQSDVGIGPGIWKATVDHIRLMQTDQHKNMPI